jgi:hypothetical protein
VSNNSELKSKGAQALRAAGYKPCPRWWLTAEQLALVEYMAKQNQDDVNRIRAEVNRPMTKEEEIERAWAKMKAGKGNTS